MAHHRSRGPRAVEPARPSARCAERELSRGTRSRPSRVVIAFRTCAAANAMENCSNVGRRAPRPRPAAASAAARLLHDEAVMQREGSLGRHRRIVLALALCTVTASAAQAAHPRFRRMVVVGDSILAGFGSGGLVTRGPTGQVNSAPADIARRAGVSLPQPLMSSPGVPAPFVIDDVNGNGQLDPGDVRRTDDSIGARARPVRVARNLAVPGEDVMSVFEEISPGVIARRLFNGDRLDGIDVLKFLILGVPPRGESVSQITRARDLRPTLLL